MKRAIFVDRDGTIVREPEDEQVDSMDKVEFVPGAISALRRLSMTSYELVLVSNQDGLGTDAFPTAAFEKVHGFIMRTLRGEGVVFSEELIDPTRKEDNKPTRKPGLGMMGKYLDGSYDLASSFVVGDRETDLQFARNLGATGLRLDDGFSWEDAVSAILRSERSVSIERSTRETDVFIRLNLDGEGESSIDTGLRFLDHMLEQLPHHGGVALEIRCSGDLDVDEHHTMEDTGIALGEAFRKAMGDKLGMERYGFSLPMDESSATVLLDFGGRSELKWDVAFTREYVGDVPTEMFEHFFKAFCSSCQCNLHISARGENNHHLAEAVFKAFARAIRQAVRRNTNDFSLPSSKGSL